MTGKAQDGAVAPRRRPRRRRWGAVAVVLVALWLAGRGMGLLGTGDPSAEQPPRGAPAGVPEPALAELPDMQPQPQAGSAPNQTGEAAPASVPTAEPLPAPAPVAEPAAPGVDADRFASMLSLVDLRLAQGEVGRACAVLASLTSQTLTPAQRAEVAERQAVARRGLADGVADVARRVAAGEVLRAQDLVRGLLEVGPAAAEALAGLPLGNAPARAVQSAPDSWPAPVPLGKGRAVRIVQDGTQRVGSVVDSRSDRLTLRVVHGQGVTFPTVAMHEVEPIDPSVAEAVAMGWAALHAGDVLRARLWLACAASRAADAGAHGQDVLERALR